MERIICEETSGCCPTASKFRLRQPASAGLISPPHRRGNTRA